MDTDNDAIDAAMRHAQAAMDEWAPAERSSGQVIVMPIADYCRLHMRWGGNPPPVGALAQQMMEALTCHNYLIRVNLLDHSVVLWNPESDEVF